MFFEGSEKKIEVLFHDTAPPLRSLKDSFWDEVVRAAGAKILSKISNEFVDAYLLSESSLFVYDRHLVMITCGRTKLIQSIRKILSHIKPQHIRGFFYERKHEVFPQYQPSHFFEDLIRLNKWFDGEAMRFGAEDDHHLFLFSSNQAQETDSNDYTMEVLMHGVRTNKIELFQKENLPMASTPVRELTQVDSLVRGQIDDHVFDPCGYSLNAIDGRHYYTIHVTPEKMGNYTSFETNAIPPHEQSQWAKNVVNLFEPTSFDIVLFNTEKAPDIQLPNYVLKNRFLQKLKSGLVTQYLTYYKPQETVEGAFIIQESEL